MVMMEILVCLDPPEQLEHVEQMASLVDLDQQVFQEALDCLAAREIQVHKVSLDRLGLRDQLEHQEQLVC